MTDVKKTVLNFWEFYEKLPTRYDQAQLRHSIIKACKIQKVTFYSWAQRGDIPDEKNRRIITELLCFADQELIFTKN